MVEMNQQVLTNLDRMISEVEKTVTEDDGHHPCELTTPTTSSPPPAAEPPPHATEPSRRCAEWTMPDNRFRSTRWRAKGTSPGPGSTTSPTYAPRSNDSVPAGAQDLLNDAFPTGNAPPTPRCGTDSKSRPNENASWRSRTVNYARHLRSPSANSARPPSSAAPRHAEKEISANHRTPLMPASTTVATKYRCRSTQQTTTELKINTVLARVPLRELPLPRPAGSCLS